MINRRKFLMCSAATGLALKFGTVWAEQEQAWADIRDFLFQDRPVDDGSQWVSIIAPERPPNGGDVPITIASRYPQETNKFIKTHHLIVDENPSPVAAKFSLSPKNGTADISTRIRVNTYSNVRIVSETNDGKLYMNKTFVKASGGCSAPPMEIDPMSKLTMGRMQLIQDDAQDNPKMRDLHLVITHPNFSGLQKDQQTLLFIPPHYIESVEIKNRLGEVVFAVKGDISFSENPSFDFSYLATENDDVLFAKAIDSRKKIYESQWALTTA